MGRPGCSRRDVVSGVLAACAMNASPAAIASTDELRFGLTPVFLSSDLELLDKLRSYLVGATGGPIRLVTRRTYQEITSLLLSGQLDAAWICGFPFVAYRESLALVAVPRWRGVPLYRAYLIAAGDRVADSIDDLRGDVHAFSDPDSNSGWLVTAAALARRGERPERFFSRTFFTYGHRNVVRAVASGLATSGSVDGYVYEVMRETEPELIAQTRVVHQSKPLGFPPIACTAAAENGDRTISLRKALLQMADDEFGRSVLTILRLDGFSLEPPSLFDPIAAEVSVLKRAAG